MPRTSFLNSRAYFRTKSGLLFPRGPENKRFPGLFYVHGPVRIQHTPSGARAFPNAVAPVYQRGKAMNGERVLVALDPPVAIASRRALERMAENSEENSQRSTARRQRGPGRPFAKGQSGNPGGRPRTEPELRARAFVYAVAALPELGRLARKARHEGARIRAISELLDRAIGRPRQAIDVTPTPDLAVAGLTARLEQLSVAQLAALAEAAAQQANGHHTPEASEGA
jgi:hypothetical protein